MLAELAATLEGISTVLAGAIIAAILVYWYISSSILNDLGNCNCESRVLSRY